MSNYKLEFRVLEINSLPTTHTHGLISVSDSTGEQSEYLLSVDIIAESKEAATQVLAEIQSEQSPYIAEYIAWIREGNEPPDTEDRVETADTFLTPGISSVTIHHLSEDGTKEDLGIIVTMHGVNRRREHTYVFTEDRPGYVVFSNIKGKIKVTARSSRIVVASFSEEPIPREHLFGPFSKTVTLTVTNGRNLDSQYDINPR